MQRAANLATGFIAEPRTTLYKAQPDKQGVALGHLEFAGRLRPTSPHAFVHSNSRFDNSGATDFETGKGGVAWKGARILALPDVTEHKASMTDLDKCPYADWYVFVRFQEAEQCNGLR